MKFVLEKIVLTEKDRDLLKSVLKKEETSMPDITMCEGLDCPLKQKCYRYMAKPDTYQTYFMPPYKDGKCEFFMKIERKKDIDKDKIE